MDVRLCGRVGGNLFPYVSAGNGRAVSMRGNIRKPALVPAFESFCGNQDIDSKIFLFFKPIRRQIAKFYRYQAKKDLSFFSVWRYNVKKRGDDNMAKFEEISALLQRGKAKDLAALIAEELNNGTAPKDILTKGLIAGMSVVGEKFKNNEIFVPEVLIAARAMNAALMVLKPALAETGVEPVGTAIICTVKGDLHDIGKNLVKMMIEGTGIRVIDLGVDCSAEKVVNAVREYNADIVCLSSLLTTTMLYQKDIIEALKAAGLRDKVKVMVGGAPVTQAFADEIGADAYTPDAASAAEKARSYFG